jgi:hypothetical protein
MYHNNNINFNNLHKDELNTYKRNEQEKEPKMFSYCWKCLRDFDEPTTVPFCDFRCYQEYCQEERKELDACFGEFLGRD